MNLQAHEKCTGDFSQYFHRVQLYGFNVQARREDVFSPTTPHSVREEKLHSRKEPLELLFSRRLHQQQMLGGKASQLPRLPATNHTFVPSQSPSPFRTLVGTGSATMSHPAQQFRIVGGSPSEALSGPSTPRGLCPAPLLPFIGDELQVLVPSRAHLAVVCRDYLYEATYAPRTPSCSQVQRL